MQQQHPTQHRTSPARKGSCVIPDANTSNLKHKQDGAFDNGSEECYPAVMQPPPATPTLRSACSPHLASPFASWLLASGFSFYVLLSGSKLSTRPTPVSTQLWTQLSFLSQQPTGSPPAKKKKEKKKKPTSRNAGPVPYLLDVLGDGPHALPLSSLAPRLHHRLCARSLVLLQPLCRTWSHPTLSLSTCLAHVIPAATPAIELTDSPQASMPSS